MTQSKKIAITGGIGSGKTAVSGILRGWGYVVFSCDEIAAQLWSEPEFLRLLSERFPQDTVGGKIDRKKLSAHVFSDETALRTLDELTHPPIMERLMREMTKFALSFAEVPLLYEGGYETLFDGVIAIRRPIEARIGALQARSGYTRAEIEARMAQQLDASALPGKGCYLIENDSSLEMLGCRVKAALKYFGVA